MLADRVRDAVKTSACPSDGPQLVMARTTLLDLALWDRVNSMSSRQTLIQRDTDFRVLRILQETPDITQRELAEKLGVSVSGLNYCMKALIAKGWVKMQNFGHSKNKFGYVYVLTPRGISQKAALTSEFLIRKMQEYEALRIEIESLQFEVDNQPIEITQKA